MPRSTEPLLLSPKDNVFLATANVWWKLGERVTQQGHPLPTIQCGSVAVPCLRWNRSAVRRSRGENRTEMSYEGE